MPIPSFNLDGLLPPYLGATPGDAAPLMSPYNVPMMDFVATFATSPERIQILRGLLQYRAELVALGFVSGFQWLDGSFVEDDRVRPPADVDIVTFIDRPVAARSDAAFGALLSAHPHLFKKSLAKPRYKCDVHFVDMSQPGPQIVNMTRYFFGLFSHRRATFQWKGMVQVPLATPADDANAATLL